MDPIDQLVEQKVREAIARGDFDDLPGAGAPVVLDDLSMVPAHLRAGYRLLKNAGYLPPEIEAAKALREAEDLLARIEDPSERSRELQRLRLLEVRLRELGGRTLARGVRAEYLPNLCKKLGGD